MDDVLALLLFEFTYDEWVQHWLAYPDVDLPDGMDCLEVSNAFTKVCQTNGLTARTIRLEPPEPQPWYAEHYVTLVGDTCVDWTARQFYNAAQDPADWKDPNTIDTPLVYPRNEGYPLDWVRLEEVECEFCGGPVAEPVYDPGDQFWLPERQWRRWCSAQCHEDDAEQRSMR